MKSFATKIGLFVVLQLAIACCIYAVYVRKYPPSAGFYAATIDKHRVLEQQQSPRLIFIGGSATCFGINSSEVAERCGYHAVNLGLHALLGLNFQLTECENDLKPGDVVVISPEYPQFSGRFWGEPDALLSVIQSRPDNLHYIGPHQVRNIMDEGFLNRAGIILRAAFGRGIEKESPVYRRFGFNTVGDMVAHYKQPPLSALHGQIRFHYDTNGVQDIVEFLNAFTDRCRARDIKVFYAHPPLAHSQFVTIRDDLLKLDAHLQRTMKMPMLDSLMGADLGDDNFYDTPFHLRRPAVVRHSEALAAELKSQLAPQQMAKSPSKIE